MLRENLESFLAFAQTAEHAVPRHVEAELREYLKCGVLGHGFVRVRCNDCGKSMAVGLTCTSHCTSCAH
ncbi:MAG: transposase zinc-binding domain-containing protein [Desulfobacterales bacterium]|nr:transposase zinc-binding domain-containing protein [Desulfobacterales bacterium]